MRWQVPQGVSSIGRPRATGFWSPPQTPSPKKTAFRHAKGRLPFGGQPVNENARPRHLSLAGRDREPPPCILFTSDRWPRGSTHKPLWIKFLGLDANRCFAVVFSEGVSSPSLNVQNVPYANRCNRGRSSSRLRNDNRDRELPFCCTRAADHLK